MLYFWTTQGVKIKFMQNFGVYLNSYQFVAKAQGVYLLSEDSLAAMGIQMLSETWIADYQSRKAIHWVHVPAQKKFAVPL